MSIQVESFKLFFSWIDMHKIKKNDYFYVIFEQN